MCVCVCACVCAKQSGRLSSKTTIQKTLCQNTLSIPRLPENREPAVLRWGGGIFCRVRSDFSVCTRYINGTPDRSISLVLQQHAAVFVTEQMQFSGIRKKSVKSMPRSNLICLQNILLLRVEENRRFSRGKAMLFPFHLDPIFGGIDVGKCSCFHRRENCGACTSM